MPQPKKAKETEKEYLSRCMSDNEMKSEYPDSDQRYAVCKSKASETIFHKALKVIEDSVGSEEEITEDNFYVPAESEYEDFGETEEEWDIAADRPGLWENIRRKKDREGKNYKPAKPGDPDRPDPDSWKKAQSGSMEDYAFQSKEAAEKMAKKIGLSGVHSHEGKDGKTLWMPGKNMEEFQNWYNSKASYAHKAGPMEDYVFLSKDEAMKMAKKIGMDSVHTSISGDGKTLYIPGETEEEFIKWYKEHDGVDASASYKYEDPKTGEVFTYKRRGIYKKNGRTLVLVRAAKYQGRTVKLNKPFRTPDGPKKFSVYVKNEKGNVVKVNFGDPNMEIKKDDPARRKSFRARHKCDTPGPKWKARYWSCKNW
jgi:hypothetical protein